MWSIKVYLTLLEATIVDVDVVIGIVVNVVVKILVNIIIVTLVVVA